MSRLLHPTHPLQLAWGLLLWSVWFVLIYVVQALSCVSPAPHAAAHPTAVNTALLMIGVGFTAVMVWMMWRCLRASRQAALPPTGRFIALTAAVLHGTATFSTVFVALPLWRLPPCL